MHPILKNIIAIITGFVGGSIINMAILNIGGNIIPPPEGADTSTMEGLKQAMSLYTPIHFLMPFLAHALGTLTGSLLAGMIAATYSKILSLVVGVFFMVGGITAILMLPSPLWFSITDLTLAYLPMAWIGWKLSSIIKSKKRKQ